MKDKKKSRALIIFKLCLLLFFIPFILGQSQCGDLQEAVDNFLEGRGIGKPPAPTGPNGSTSTNNNSQYLYITTLSFWDAVTKQFIPSEVAALINESVLQGIHLAQKSNSNIKHNETGHKIEDTDDNKKRLIEITFDGQLTQNQKIETIINEMMRPNNVDVIISGMYIDQGTVIQLRPYGVDRDKKAIVSKNKDWEKADFMCSDPVTPSRKILCTNAREEIAQMVKEILNGL